MGPASRKSRRTRRPSRGRLLDALTTGPAVLVSGLLLGAAGLLPRLEASHRSNIPNGDYTIFVGRDHAFGIVGHPWEQSLCVFGELAVNAFAARNQGALPEIRRR